jgi:DNA replication protein DnaC
MATGSAFIAPRLWQQSWPKPRTNTSCRRLEQAINKAALLIIDDLSYITFNRRHSELLFKLIAERTERASIIISTNLEFSRWTELFDDPMLTAALVRLTYKARILNMNGESYRFKHRQPSKE